MNVVSITLLFLFLFSTPSYGKLSFSAAEYESELGAGDVTAKGNVRVWEGDQSLYADRVRFNQISGEIRADGNVYLKAADQVVYGQSLQYNFNTRTGKILYGGAEIRGQVLLTGNSIEKVGKDHYIVEKGTYTSCLDCPRSWYFAGSTLDVTFEGYAFVSDAVFVANNIPLSYLPRLIFPVKVKRQSGVIDPRYDFSDLHGFNLGLSYFFAMDYSYDSTIGYDWFSKRGHLLSGEGRWMTSPFEYGQVNVHGLYDQMEPVDPNDSILSQAADRVRGATSIKVIQRAGDYRFAIYSQLASDSGFPNQFSYLDNSRGATSLKSELLVDRPLWSGVLTAGTTYYQDIQPRSSTPYLQEKRSPPARLPMVSFDLPNFPLWWSGGQWLRGITFSANTSYTNFFARGSNYLNVETGSGSESATLDSDDIILSGQRVLLTPRLVAPITLGRYVHASNELTAISTGYLLNDPVSDPVAGRQEVQFFSRVGAAVDRVYDVSEGNFKSVRHSIDGFARYRYTPFVVTSDHQIFTRRDAVTNGLIASGFSGFDDEDVISRKHRIGYEVHHRLILKMLERNSAVYRTGLTFSTTQDYDFLASTKPFTPLANSLTLTWFEWSGSVNAATDVYTLETNISASILYDWIEKQYVRTGVSSNAMGPGHTTDWNLGLRLNLFWGWTLETYHNFSQSRKALLSDWYLLSFKPSSRCWSFGSKLARSIDRPGVDIKFQFGLDLGGNNPLL